MLSQRLLHRELAPPPRLMRLFYSMDKASHSEAIEKEGK